MIQNVSLKEKLILYIISFILILICSCSKKQYNHQINIDVKLCRVERSLIPFKEVKNKTDIISNIEMLRLVYKNMLEQIEISQVCYEETISKLTSK